MRSSAAPLHQVGGALPQVKFTICMNEFELTGGCMHIGVAAPPGNTPTLPFRVSRSKYRNLPVYTDYKSGGSQVLTSVRKVEGNLEVNILC